MKRFKILIKCQSDRYIEHRQNVKRLAGASPENFIKRFARVTEECRPDGKRE